MRYLGFYFQTEVFLEELPSCCDTTSYFTWPINYSSRDDCIDKLHNGMEQMNRRDGSLGPMKWLLKPLEVERPASHLANAFARLLFESQRFLWHQLHSYDA